MLRKKERVNRTVKWLTEGKSEQDKEVRISCFNLFKNEDFLWLKEGQPVTCLLEIAL